jgi:DNA-binding NtrC family response regulator
LVNPGLRAKEVSGMAEMGNTVLVIDDEAPIRRLVQRMLEPALCRVLQADSAEAGLRLIEGADPPVDVVLTDWIMPGLHGLDVVEVLHRHRPELPVAVISAYTSTIHPIVREGGGLRILQKPFTAGELQHAVAGMIARAVEVRGQSRRMRERAAAARAESAERRRLGALVNLVDAAWELHRNRNQ